MIGQFRFATLAPDECVSIVLQTIDGNVVANVVLPASVMEVLGQFKYPIVAPEEVMQLPFALGYGVIVSALTNSALVLTGDRAAWPVDWGLLVAAH